MKEARAVEKYVIVGGDWNAEVEATAGERDAVAGAYENMNGNM